MVIGVYDSSFQPQTHSLRAFFAASNWLRCSELALDLKSNFNYYSKLVGATCKERFNGDWRPGTLDRGRGVRRSADVSAAPTPWPVLLLGKAEHF
eukprot:5511772-Pleurochrysis_carterae.AAC.7